MKLIIIILFTTLMQVSASTFGQKVTLAERNTSLEKVFQKMRQQTGYDFLFDAEVVKVAKPVNINVSNAPLSEALELCLKNQNLDFTIEEKSVIVSRAKEKGFLDNLIARFQSIDVRGKVVDSLGNGLAGATVSVKNGKQSTQTAANGDFYLKNVEENAVLIISYLGYVTKEQPASKEFNHIQLQMSTSKLDEVQVIAYGTTSRRLGTGNITTIKAQDIEKQNINNPLLALQGRVPNLIVTPATGLPGTPIKIQLRGQNSLTGLTSEPLIVIDGIPFINTLSGSYFGYNNFSVSALGFINPSDIESIDVLTDADATSIYGSRGGNGVILITTKKGKPGITKMNFSLNSGYGEIERSLNVLNTSQYLEMRREAYSNDGLSIPSKNSPVADRTFENYDLTFWDEERSNDWQKELLSGQAQQYNVQGSIQGGSNNVQYFVSGSLNKLGYLFPGDNKFITGAGRFSISGKSLNKRFALDLNGGLTSTAATNSGSDVTFLAMSLAPNAPSLYKDDGTLNWEIDPQTGYSTFDNPIANVRNVSTSKVSIINATTVLNYALLSNLTLATSLGFSDTYSDNYFPITIASQNPTNLFASGSAFFGKGKANSISLDPYLKYIQKINQGQLQIMIGGSWQKQTNTFQRISGGGFTSDALLKDISKADNRLISGGNTSSEYKSVSVFGRINYNWQDKYIGNINLRRDGSSRFGPKDKFGNFWSVAGAWNFSNEDFVKSSLKVISFGKIRASYGSGGNDNIGDYKYLELFESLLFGSVTYQGVKPIVSPGAVNAYYTWEDIRKGEVGLDLGIFKDRVIIGASRWTNISSNQLGQLILPATTGGYAITINQPAKIENTGWDYTANIRTIDGKNFTWSTNLNMGYQRNRLLVLPDSYTSTTPSIQYFKERKENPVGRPFSGMIPVYESKGVDKETGMFRFSDKEGNINPLGFGYLYSKLINTNPQFSGGVSNAFTYRGVTLDIFMQFVKQLGRDVKYEGLFAVPGTNQSGYLGNQLTDVMQRWRKPGDISEFQRFTATGQVQGSPATAFDTFNNKFNSNDSWVDASFIKLRNVAISYDVPKSLLKRAGLDELKCYIRAQNLLTITKYKGLDPETQSSSRLPQLRTFIAGIQLSL
ncbi:SusC/RagA family TonB-linked outer membrane protein [Pedobacter sp. JY14-1]|uniref:SusC/RagA family TonB-linked outer membrane protein n=1 Tax=Pedobacter sp. JY14-1 TaxID=3034151 RepID=UPI0023E27601|nr:SusC/RagA family TonB-linked outer membrane protein [Pedobacter sp. JY14-1]